MTNPFADIAPDDAPTAGAPTSAATNAAKPATASYDTSNPFADIGSDEGYADVQRDGKGDIERPTYSQGETALIHGIAGFNPFANEIASTYEGLWRGAQDPMNFGTRFSEGYSDMMGRTRQTEDRSREDNPTTATVARVGGALLSTPIGGRYVAAAKTIPQMALRGAIVGGTQNAIYEAGDSDADTLSGRLDAGLEGAKTGALLGGGIPLGIGALRGAARVAGAVSRPADGLKSSIMPGSAARVAERRVGEALKADLETERGVVDAIYQQRLAKAKLDGAPVDEDALRQASVRQTRDTSPRMSPDDFVEARAAGQMPIAADMGGANVADLAAKAAQADPSAAAMLKGASAARSRGVAGRMKDYVSRVVLPEFGTDEATVADTLSRLKESARAQNAHRYAAAEANPNASQLWNEKLAELSQAPAVWSVMQDVVRRSGNVGVGRRQGRVFSPFGLDDAGNVVIKNPDVAPNFNFWDKTKRGLDDEVSALRAAGRKDQAAEVAQLRDVLRDELDTIIPEYRQARSGAASAFGAEDALDAGRKFASNMDAMKTSTLQRSLSEMSDAERKLAAHGFTEEIIQRARNTGSIAFLDQPGMRGKINLMAGGAESGQRLVNFLFRERVISNFAKVAEASPGVAAKGADGWVAESLMGTLVTSMLTGDGFGPGDIAGGLGVALGKRAIGRRAGRGNAKIQREIAAILTENDPARLQKLLAASTKSGEMSDALKRLAVASERMAAAGARVGPAEQHAAERVEPQLGYVTGAAQPFARGGGVRLARPLPGIVTIGEAPDIEELLKPRRRKALAEGGLVNDPAFQEYPDELRDWRESEGHYADGEGNDGVVLVAPQTEDGSALDELEKHLEAVGRKVKRGLKKMLVPERHEMLGDDVEAERGYARGGLVEAQPENNAARDAYLGVEGSTGAQPDRTAYDHKGRHTQKLNMRGPTAVASSNSRRSTVTMGDRDRLRPERMRSAAPPVDPRQFWRDLQQALADHAMQRGLTVPDGMFPVFDEPEAVMPVTDAHDDDEAAMATKPKARRAYRRVRISGQPEK